MTSERNLTYKHGRVVPGLSANAEISIPDKYLKQAPTMDQFENHLNSLYSPGSQTLSREAGNFWTNKDRTGFKKPAIRF